LSEESWKLEVGDFSVEFAGELTLWLGADGEVGLFWSAWSMAEERATNEISPIIRVRAGKLA